MSAILNGKQELNTRKVIIVRYISIRMDITERKRTETVNPTFGTMIIFLSESFPHEVLVAHANRRSIAGWFRVSGS
ncbi:MAG TPA: 2OG-Fe(II) oxygenase [Gallionella sp.]|nr:2OG-Fe(II) oxygenase [Gallionella sp.]